MCVQDIVTIINNASKTVDFNKIVEEEGKKFENGFCPECGTKLVRVADSFIDRDIHYSLPKCTKCEIHYSTFFWPTGIVDKIQKKIDKHFIEMVNALYQ